jgi:hypothetical protein
MSWPEESFTLHGGCACYAIRYRINVPTLRQRPVSPYAKSPQANEEPIHRLPFSCIDHCNDCRKNTGSLVNYWLAQPPEWIEWSCDITDVPSRKPSAPVIGITHTDSEAREANENSRAWFSTHDVLQTEAALHHNRAPFPFLALWNSSVGRTRSFCSRCGTTLTYLAHTNVPPEFNTIEIQIGTLDRDDLEKFGKEGGGLKPEKQLWGRVGLGWVKEMTMGKTKMDCHEGYLIDEGFETSS